MVGTCLFGDGVLFLLFLELPPFAVAGVDIVMIDSEVEHDGVERSVRGGEAVDCGGDSKDGPVTDEDSELGEQVLKILTL